METLKYPNLKGRDYTPELVFSSSRSSGPGGQNINKVNTRVELRFNIAASDLLTESEKQTLIKKLKSQLTSEGELIIVSQTERSQLRNKKEAIAKFYTLLNKNLTKRKRRIPTKATKASQVKRIEIKRKHAEIKSFRKNIPDE